MIASRPHSPVQLRCHSCSAPTGDPTATDCAYCGASFGSRACPRCHSRMAPGVSFCNRVNYARISGIVIDVCREHGSWFDAHELPAVLEFVRHGGLGTARARDTERLAEERRRLERERMMRTRSVLSARDRPAGLGVSAFGARPESRAQGLFGLLGELFRDGRLR